MAIFYGLIPATGAAVFFGIIAYLASKEVDKLTKQNETLETKCDHLTQQSHLHMFD